MQASLNDGQGARRPRVLVAVTYGLGVRYVLPTGVLDDLAGSTDLLVAVGWDAPDLVEELDRRGIGSVRIPDAVLDHGLRRHRRQMDLIHQRRLASPSTAIERRQREALVERRKDRMIGRLRRTRDGLAVRIPGAAARIEAAERTAMERGSNLAEVRRFLSALDVDLLVVVTPYHEQDTLLLVAADDLGVRSLTSVISFDNPTTRRRFPMTSERIVVWNRFNRSELLRSYPGLEEDQIVQIGAPQFDLHHRPELVIDELTWRQRTGLPPGRPVILYGGGPSILVPEEPRLVRLIDAMIDDGRVPGHPVVLVRRHPADDPAPWRALSTQLRHGVVAEPWEPGTNLNRGWPTTADLEIQMSSLAHSSVHVNVCSSMTLDGAAFDRPQVGPTFVPGLDRRSVRRVRDLYAREHWWPITESGGLVTADTPEQLAAAIGAALTDPTAGRADRRRMLDDLLGVDDGRAGSRLVAEVLRSVPAPAASDRLPNTGGSR